MDAEVLEPEDLRNEIIKNAELNKCFKSQSPQVCVSARGAGPRRRGNT